MFRPKRGFIRATGEKSKSNDFQNRLNGNLSNNDRFIFLRAPK